MQRLSDAIEQLPKETQGMMIIDHTRIHRSACEERVLNIVAAVWASNNSPRKYYCRITHELALGAGRAGREGPPMAARRLNGTVVPIRSVGPTNDIGTLRWLP